MNIQYAKTILYAYPKIENTVKSYDKKIERKALDAMLDKRSCLTICDEIIDLKLTKAALFDIGVITTKILAKFSKEELDCIRYKYFKINVEGLDTTNPRNRKTKIRTKRVNERWLDTCLVKSSSTKRQNIRSC